MKFLIAILIILANLTSGRNISHCVENDRRTYLIPSADYCLPNYDIGGDRYLFGPCNSSKFGCWVIEQKCKFAKGRDKYCLGRDGHFCAFIDKGGFINYYLVECG